MARDETYQTKAYRPQGGAEFVVQGSTASLTALSTDGILQLANITTATKTTTSTTCTNSGLTIVRATTGGGAYVCNVAAPVAGALKFLYAEAANTSDTVTFSVTNGAASFAEGSGSRDKLLFSRTGGGAILFGLSATKWAVVGSHFEVAGTTATALATSDASVLVTS